MEIKRENTAVIPAIFMTGSGGQKKTEKHRESEPAGTASRNRPHLPAFFAQKKAAEQKFDSITRYPQIEQYHWGYSLKSGTAFPR